MREREGEGKRVGRNLIWFIKFKKKSIKAKKAFRLRPGF